MGILSCAFNLFEPVFKLFLYLFPKRYRKKLPSSCSNELYNLGLSLFWTIFMYNIAPFEITPCLWWYQNKVKILYSSLYRSCVFLFATIWSKKKKKSFPDTELWVIFLFFFFLLDLQVTPSLLLFFSSFHLFAPRLLKLGLCVFVAGLPGWATFGSVAKTKLSCLQDKWEFAFLVSPLVLPLSVTEPSRLIFHYPSFCFTLR